MARLVTDPPNVEASIDGRLADILQAVFTVIYGCLMAFYFDWRMALIEIFIVGMLGGMQVGEYFLTKHLTLFR